MAITWNFSVDWDQNGFLAKNTSLTDPVNLLGADSARTSNFYIDGTYDTLTWMSDYGAPISFDAPEIGAASITALTDGLGNYNYSATAGTYRAVVFFRPSAYSQSGAFIRSFNVEVFGSVSGSLGTGSGNFQPAPEDPAAGNYNFYWRRAVVAFTVASTQNISIEITVTDAPSNGAATAYIGGLMIVSGTTAPTAFNCGALSLYETVTPYVMDGNWNTGFTRPYTNIADMGRLTLTLQNSNKWFSPENASSPIYGQWRGAFVAVDVTVPTTPTSTQYRVWSGWVDDIQPQAGTSGAKTAALYATDTRRFLEGVDGRISTQVGKKIEEIYNTIIDLATANIVTTDGFSPLEDLAVTSSQTIPYAADQWDDGIDVLRALQDTAAAIHDKFLFDENAYRRRYTVDQMYGNTGTAGTACDYSISRMVSGRYTYGRDVINDVSVDYYPRKAGTATTSLLWDLDDAITLDPKEVYTLRARYNDDTSDITISGLSAYGTALTASSGISVTGTVFKSQSADVTFTNSQNAAGSVTAYQIRGQKLKAKNKVTYTQSDADSVTEVGRIGAQFNYKLLWRANSTYGAKTFAAEVLRQRSKPIGKFTEITIKPVSTTEENLYIATQLTGSAFKSVRVTDSQVEHDGFYWLIGVAYNWRTAGFDYDITWYLEPQANAFRLDDGVFGVLDYGRI